MRHPYANPTLQAVLPALRQGGTYACAPNVVSMNIAAEGSSPAA
jgi:hypothetical protein